MVVAKYIDCGTRTPELAILFPVPRRNRVSDQLQRPLLEPLHRKRRHPETPPYHPLTVLALLPPTEKTLIQVGAHHELIVIPARRV
jgi:hypothetical protein